MNKTNNSDKNIAPVKKQRNFLKNLVCVTLLVIFAAVLLGKERLASVKNMFFAQEKSAAIVADNELIQEALEESYSVGAEPPLLSFAPEEASETSDDYTEEDLEEINPYVTIIEEEADPSESTKLIMLNHNLNEYRLYIANANKLIDKFKADKSYELELQILKKRLMPGRVEAVVLLLEAYNQQLVKNQTITNNVVKPFDSKVLAQFLTIKKIPSEQQGQKSSKDEISKSLNILRDYIFSSELQGSFLSK
jgi:hypothetical protein